MSEAQILPGTGRGTAAEGGGGGGPATNAALVSGPLHRTSCGPPPRAGEEFRGTLQESGSLADFIWFRTGGPAEWLARPADVADLSAFLRALDPATPVMAVGVGSNLIVRDGGVPGVVVRLPKAFARVAIEADGRVRAGGAAMGITVASAARDAGLAGLEFLRGIPGTVGGAVRMNAGAYGRDVSDILVEVTLVLRDGRVETWPTARLDYSYRHSELPKGAIVVEALFQGTPGDPAAIGAEMDRIAAEREASQPLRSRTGGSTFKNPPGHKAWALIDAAGCRGLRRGDAQVSEKHCNFLLNLGAATSAEIEVLGEEVRASVLAHAGVTLDWEIQRVGIAPVPSRNEEGDRPAQPGGGGGPPQTRRLGPGPLHQPAAGPPPRSGQEAVALHVAVLMGGWSAERAVSLVSGEGVAGACERLGHRVTRIDMGRDVAQRLADAAPDVVFNALHGTPGEDGTVQGLLDLMGLTYTHSGLAASVIAIDKQLTKNALVPHGIRMPEGRIVASASLHDADPLPRPYVVKPVNEGSSVGVAIVTDDSNYGQPIGRDVNGPWRHFAHLLAEPYIKGRELTVSVLGGADDTRALGITELIPKAGWYDYDAKYTDGLTTHVCPAENVPDDVAESMLEMSVAAHRLLGCRGVSRSDFRWDEEAGEAGLYLLEVNTQPGMTPLSLVPEQAKLVGLSYDELVQAIIDEALA